MAKKKAAKKKPATKKIPAKTDQGVKVDRGKVDIKPYPSAEKTVGEFENKLDAQIAGGKGGPGDETRGGKRPGAGRPKKSTNLKAETDRIAELSSVEPNPLFLPFIETPFVAWAEKTGIKEIELKDKDARAICKPVTGLVEYYLPIIAQNPILAMWFGLASAITAATWPRLKLVREVRIAKGPAAAVGKDAKSERTPTSSPADPDIKPVGPTGFPAINLK